MTTYQLPLDRELSDALTDLANHLERQGDFSGRYIRGLAGAAAEGNGMGATAELPWAVRPGVAAAARTVADGHPAGDKLRDLAAGLEESVRAARVNGVRI